VGDDFAYLLERVARHHGFIVKTVGDAVMAAFHDPVDVVHAVLSMQYEVASFNRGAVSRRRSRDRPPAEMVASPPRY
jgi:class 3 adenylate cyclase